MRRPGLGVRHLPGGHGQGRRRPHQAAGQRLLQDPGPLHDPREAHQRRRRGSHPQAPAGEERHRRDSALQAIYAKQSANFKTLFDFVDGAKTYRNYTDADPLRRHLPVRQLPVPAVPGRDRGHLRPQRLRGQHSSVGERSMLGVFQQVAKDIGNVERSGSWRPSTTCSRASAPR